MDRRLDSLAPSFKTRVFELLARLTESGLPVCIVNTRRTDAEQADALARGVSWVARSKHQDGLAIDLCPYDVYQLHGPDKLQWSSTDAAWARMGAIGEGLGFRWGGRWTVKDLGHFEQGESWANAMRGSSVA